MRMMLASMLLLFTACSTEPTEETPQSPVDYVQESFKFGSASRALSSEKKVNPSDFFSRKCEPTGSQTHNSKTSYFCN